MTFNDFYERYFLINLSDYPNIGINLPITQIIFGLVIGAIIGSIIINLLRSGTHSVVKALIRYEARDEESARTLDEMRINTFSVRAALSSGGRLMKLISWVGKKEYTYEEYVALQKEKGFRDEKPDHRTSRLYLTAPDSDEVKSIFEKSGASLLHTVLFSVFLVAIFLCLTFLMPEILSFINDLLAK